MLAPIITLADLAQDQHLIKTNALSQRMKSEHRSPSLFSQQPFCLSSILVYPD